VELAARVLLPEESTVQHAARVLLPAADAAAAEVVAEGEVRGAAAAARAEAVEPPLAAVVLAGVEVLRRAAAVPAGPVQRRAVARPSVAVCHPYRARLLPVQSPAARFAHAMAGLRIASP
jgi:hypothetical protein